MAIIDAMPMPATGTPIAALLPPGTSRICVPGNPYDDCLYNIYLPFGVMFYEQVHYSAAIWENGFVQFPGSDWRAHNHMNLRLPAAGYGAALFPFWDDIEYGLSTEGIFASIEGVAPNRALVIEWRGHYFNDTRVPVNFALRMYESVARFDVVYRTTQVPPGT